MLRFLGLKVSFFHSETFTLDAPCVATRAGLRKVESQTLAQIGMNPGPEQNSPSRYKGSRLAVCTTR